MSHPRSAAAPQDFLRTRPLAVLGPSILVGLALGVGSSTFETFVLSQRSAHAEADEVGDREGPEIQHEAIDRAPQGRALQVRARIADPSGVFAPSVSFRPLGSKAYESVPMRELATDEHEVPTGAVGAAGRADSAGAKGSPSTKARESLVRGGSSPPASGQVSASGSFSLKGPRPSGGWFGAEIPPSAVVSDLEYFVEAFDQLGNGPTQFGSPANPLVVRVYAVGTEAFAEGSNERSGEFLTPPIAPKDPSGDPLAVMGPSPERVHPLTASPSLGSGRSQVSPPPSSGLQSKWWFWTLLAATAAAGTAVAVAFAASADSSPLTEVNLVIRGPDPSGGP